MAERKTWRHQRNRKDTGAPEGCSADTAILGAEGALDEPGNYKG
jgi:hypothetical protein